MKQDVTCRHLHKHRHCAGARRAQGSWEQFIPSATFTICRLEWRVIYFCVLVLCLCRDSSSVPHIDQRGSIYLVLSRDTLSPRTGWKWLSRLRTDLCCKTSPCCGFALHGWCQLSPSWVVRGGCSPFSPEELWEGDENWSYFAP